MQHLRLESQQKQMEGGMPRIFQWGQTGVGISKHYFEGSSGKINTLQESS